MRQLLDRGLDRSRWNGDQQLEPVGAKSDALAVVVDRQRSRTGPTTSR
ncbi:MAG: hypothetical protein ACRDYX_12510 [Egibacteraceae bacterium]